MIAGESGEYNWTERLLFVCVDIWLWTACWLIKQLFLSVSHDMYAYTDRITWLLLLELFAPERIYQVCFDVFTSHCFEIA